MAINSDFRHRLAEGAIPAYSLVKPGSQPKSAVIATAATDKIIGTSDELPHVVGEFIDMAVGPVPLVLLGAAVAAGDPLTANGAGAAIVAAAGNRIIGFAEVPGVAGDVITYLRSPGVL